ncbi:Protein RRNAD1 [Orchesella cincta]|uniref:Protein RRNAD1 n=1 Tax=Orchesella cincta TaxID=48709 RepID=A0A1D2MFE1_ORCCI|nr:Protein RRNAD1 [Orchesella cincta]
MIVVQVEDAEHWIAQIKKFVSAFSWLQDSFVLDFYINNHWSKLPTLWKEFLPTLTPNDLADLIDLEKQRLSTIIPYFRTVPPLSLLAFKASVSVLSLSRTFSPLKLKQKHTNNQTEVHPEFKKLFHRHVKLKKRTEVVNTANILSSLCTETGSTHVYDIGSGLGHLSRYLSYGCNVQTTCVDKIQDFGQSATKFDKELESFLIKKSISGASPPSHVCLTLELNKHEQYFEHLSHQFGFTGLHACGNLSPVIIHNFVNSPAKFLVSVGCCYMKLDDNGFPLSATAKHHDLKFSYEALEVACHANEQYCERLRNGQVRKLMTHSYRAALETILVGKGLRRAGLKGVPHTEQLEFYEYATAAISRVPNLTIDNSELTTPYIKDCVNDWFKVVIFYSLRLLTANVVETAVLLDRSLFVKEQVPNSNVEIIPIFNPNVGPRNLAIVCVK